MLSRIYLLLSERLEPMKIKTLEGFIDNPEGVTQGFIIKSHFKGLNNLFQVTLHANTAIYNGRSLKL